MAQELRFNDNGTMRLGSEAWFNDNGTMREASEIWFNDNGVMRQIYSGIDFELLTDEFCEAMSVRMYGVDDGVHRSEALYGSVTGPFKVIDWGDSCEHMLTVIGDKDNEINLYEKTFRPARQLEDYINDYIAGEEIHAISLCYISELATAESGVTVCGFQIENACMGLTSSQGYDLRSYDMQLCLNDSNNMLFLAYAMPSKEEMNAEVASDIEGQILGTLYLAPTTNPAKTFSVEFDISLTIVNPNAKEPSSSQSSSD